ncbi:carboxylesterase family protein [Variovorax sp. J22R133]|uniref:carboxylesterase/lipase family protein n=1 Tax=Variovorax brevis TaxID=3053503 RepID=UPI0025754785|nr:carboxylesterase family protein [Variovorax sp. J22R133]MDM0116044.1 carboxylesterase family protein [Variovorax sp. J22R133]
MTRFQGYSKMQSICLLGAAVLLTACAGMPGSQGSMDTVKTESGLVRGKGSEVHAYLGIPYAAAPIGENRWRAPLPALKWNGIRDGSAFGPDCMQPAEYPELRGAGMSEDCLSVNVWSPANQPGEKLPVMVWIYGGGFTYGSGSHPSYDGEALAKRGVVVATLNYRLGLLGFMAHPELSAENATRSSGNYGLQDQIAALKWVQRNVGAFGGDAAKVTVFGQSAGAHSISTLISSPMADVLFQQAIMQSVGVMRPVAPLKEAENFGASIGASIKDLRAVPASELVERLKKASARGQKIMTWPPLSIVADGLVVRQPDFKAYGQGQFQRVRVVVGNVANEGAGLHAAFPSRQCLSSPATSMRTFPASKRGPVRPMP